MNPILLPPYDLAALYKCPAANQISGFREIAAQVIPEELIAAYERLRASVPRRHIRNKSYFVGHTGITSTGAQSIRREEHLAVALWNASRRGTPLQLPDGRPISLLDYQFPLKARRDDEGVGKVDLFGVIDNFQPSVIELKIDPASPGLGDTPLRAFFEALAYCAIVEANARDIAKEAADKFEMYFKDNLPALIIMAPDKYWRGYIDHPRTGDWWPALRGLADQLNSALGLESHFLSLSNADFTMGFNGLRPALVRVCSLVDVADLVSSEVVDKKSA